MSKQINLKKITSCAVIALSASGALVSQPSLAGVGNSNRQSCNSNNGHGNNADVLLTLPSKTIITVTKFDPSNPGNGGYMEKRINAANANLSSVDFADAQAQLQQMVHDVELHGLSSSSLSCGNSEDGNPFVPIISQGLNVFAD